jgi:dTMP kinase
MKQGKLITLEGLDGAGKSTHLPRVSQLISEQGRRVRVTREPGGTMLGEALRALLLDSAQSFHAETEALLMFAARREHVDKVILPALNAGVWVVCDRFTDASFAYQSGGSGVAWEKIAILEDWVHPDLQPDLTLYFDVSPSIGRARASASRTPDRYEQERGTFHERVRAAYLRRAQESRGRIRVVDGSGTIEDVQRELDGIVGALCAEQ